MQPWPLAAVGRMWEGEKILVGRRRQRAGGGRGSPGCGADRAIDRLTCLLLCGPGRVPYSRHRRASRAGQTPSGLPGCRQRLLGCCTEGGSVAQQLSRLRGCRGRLCGRSREPCARERAAVARRWVERVVRNRHTAAGDGCSPLAWHLPSVPHAEHGPHTSGALRLAASLLQFRQASQQPANAMPGAHQEGGELHGPSGRLQQPARRSDVVQGGIRCMHAAKAVPASAHCRRRCRRLPLSTLPQAPSTAASTGGRLLLGSAAHCARCSTVQLGSAALPFGCHDFSRLPCRRPLVPAARRRAGRRQSGRRLGR